mmetsp:Transcript_32362/g.79441  ORF Transcript_32362/g.79441 Transcript_32362/m.79441 type:complete len:310 (-) Transcript_32362:534-1463(-)
MSPPCLTVQTFSTASLSSRTNASQVPRPVWSCAATCSTLNFRPLRPIPGRPLPKRYACSLLLPHSSTGACTPVTSLRLSFKRSPWLPIHTSMSTHLRGSTLPPARCGNSCVISMGSALAPKHGLTPSAPFSSLRASPQSTPATPCTHGLMAWITSNSASMLTTSSLLSLTTARLSCSSTPSSLVSRALKTAQFIATWASTSLKLPQARPFCLRLLSPGNSWRSRGCSIATQQSLPSLQLLYFAKQIVRTLLTLHSGDLDMARLGLPHQAALLPLDCPGTPSHVCRPSRAQLPPWHARPWHSLLPGFAGP